MKTNRRYRQLLMTLAVALTLGVGLVLAAQDFEGADPGAGSLNRRAAWAPGTDIPMLTYLEDQDSLPAPPR